MSHLQRSAFVSLLALSACLDLDEFLAEHPNVGVNHHGSPFAQCSGPPGLYHAGSCKQLAPGVRYYEPSYPLWSDGAEKERHIYLPDGTTIDTSHPDRWNFPKGTRLYKTFSYDGLRIETRLMEKVADEPSVDSWTFTAYAWSEDQLSVSEASADGVVDALGSGHDIPSHADCRRCHTMADLDAVNGFGAIQLNHPGPGLTLRRLMHEDVLVNRAGGEPNVALDEARIPGDGVAQAALGTLHANCGGCHGGPRPTMGLALWSVVGIHDVMQTPAYQTAFCTPLRRWTGRAAATDGEAYLLRIAPGDAAHSGIVGRMAVRGRGEQMPPLGTNDVDEDSLAAVIMWIDSLSADPCPPEESDPP